MPPARPPAPRAAHPPTCTFGSARGRARQAARPPRRGTEGDAGGGEGGGGRGVGGRRRATGVVKEVQGQRPTASAGAGHVCRAGWARGVGGYGRPVVHAHAHPPRKQAQHTCSSPASSPAAAPPPVLPSAWPQPWPAAPRPAPQRTRRRPRRRRRPWPSPRRPRRRWCLAGGRAQRWSGRPGRGGAGLGRGWSVLGWIVQHTAWGGVHSTAHTVPCPSWSWGAAPASVPGPLRPFQGPRVRSRAAGRCPPSG